ncbi:hypothetical protein CEXT_404131 [Caerostris extrusa]|uniref:Uncharacterized protein n=1 Tax=Caerostris extrusa TaxID=172846 RepID=A0AAV4NGD8_CAEEX|nr:hypothetical protein CEXT_404131 [Caerostris extrusa]
MRWVGTEAFVLLLLCTVLVHGVSILRTNNVQHERNISLNEQKSACKCNGGKCEPVDGEEIEVCVCPPGQGVVDGKSCEGGFGVSDPGCYVTFSLAVDAGI